MRESPVVLGEKKIPKRKVFAANIDPGLVSVAFCLF